MYDRYTVRLQFRDRLYGGLPRNPIQIEQYVEKGLQTSPDLAEKIATEVAAQEWIERSLVGFRRDDEKGLYISDYQIKAMLKQAASLLGVTDAMKRGGKGKPGAEVLKEGTFIRPPRIPLGHMEPDGQEVFYGHVGGSGEFGRSVVRIVEYVEQVEIGFEIATLNCGRAAFSGDELRRLLEFGQELGLGSCRSLEKGKFNLLCFDSAD